MEKPQYTGLENVRAVQLQDGLRPDACRYILGDPVTDETWSYCGKPRAVDVSGNPLRFCYCDVHYAKCVTGLSPRKKKREFNVTEDV